MPVGSSFWIADGMLHGGIEHVGDAEGGIASFRFRIRNQFLHGSHPLGWIRKFVVAVDGAPIADERLFLVVRRQWVNVRHVPTITDIWWRVGETAFVHVVGPDGIAQGEHDVAVSLTVTTLGHVPVIDRDGLYPTAEVAIAARLPVDVRVVHERSF